MNSQDPKSVIRAGTQMTVFMTIRNIMLTINAPAVIEGGKRRKERNGERRRYGRHCVVQGGKVPRTEIM
ncbi:MAG: hypothetical protein ABR903_07025 [Thermodesulfovibrionales bacterium]